MKRPLSAALLTVLVGSTTVVMAPTAAAAPGCTTVKDAITGASGEITICVEADGRARVKGNLVDTLPGAGFGTPDGVCAAWWIDWATTTGDSSGFELVVCGQWDDSPEEVFDYDPSAGENGVRGITGLNEVKLNIMRM
ncbi:hypothetical protein [Streptomyces sp. NPDC087300]|uniref:hypothetical protein n=1 Tax=Streptomyces sp. NPDC087300 TaxID=3365780 RepID=UPI003808A62A